MSAISFETTLFTIGDWTILHVPEDASAKLPSRGQVMVNASINGYDFLTPLEPDGNWSHWFKVDAKLAKAAGIAAGYSVSVQMEPTKQWPEPEIPADIQKGIAAHKEARELWPQITPMARWEWIRWIRSTSKDETRSKRIEVACSKMKAGERRPCCWNRNLCTEPSVSKNGVLLDPAKV